MAKGNQRGRDTHMVGAKYNAYMRELRKAVSRRFLDDWSISRFRKCNHGKAVGHMKRNSRGLLVVYVGSGLFEMVKK